MELLLPGTDAYEAVRRPPMPRFAGVMPAAIVRCAEAADVAEALAYARENGLDVAPRSGGHCFAGRSSTEGVVIDVAPMNDVRVEGELVRIGAGAQLADVYDALDAHGLAVPGGCGPDVGIAGLLLGGGLGVLGRAHGLLCDSLVEAEVVLAGGSTVRASEDAEPDLFWGLRGAGGGQFGVVTELTLHTVPAPASTVFHLRWPRERAAELIAAWQEWAPDAPGELAASLLCTPGGVHLFGSTTGTFRNPLGEPEEATVEALGFRAAKAWLAEHGPGEGPPGALDFAKSEFFREPLPAGAVQALADGFAAAAARGISCELDLSPWGGAYNRVAPDATAFPHRQERFLLKQAVYVPPGEDAGPAREWLERSWAAAHPFGSGGVYVNFPDPWLEDPLRAYHGPNLERLREVKAAYDPERVFTFPSPFELRGAPSGNNDPDMASYSVNPDAVEFAEQLIDSRQYVLRSEWGQVQPRADAENAYLESHSWEEYARWHLGLTEGAADETKARYAFVLGDFRRIHRMGIIACLYRAAEWRHKEVELAAHDLLQRLDAVSG